MDLAETCLLPAVPAVTMGYTVDSRHTTSFRRRRRRRRRRSLPDIPLLLPIIILLLTQTAAVAAEGVVTISTPRHWMRPCHSLDGAAVEAVEAAIWEEEEEEEEEAGAAWGEEKP